MSKILRISADPNANTEFHRITDAIESLPEASETPVIIELEPGVYHEKLTIARPYVTLTGTGASSSDTVIRYDDYANFIMPDGKKRGTFRSYTMFIDAHDVTLRNLTIENSSGDPAACGQAIALYADGDRLFVDSCRLLGRQDTLFTGPLPPKELQPDGFIGPKQFSPRINGRQYYKNCYICGDVDFIFGSATAFFEDCTIESLRRDFSDRKKTGQAAPSGSSAASGDFIQGYVTAASTPEGQEYGYVFSRCRLISADCPSGSVYLGRPWRDYARTVFLDCELGAHIHPAAFHDWGKEHAREHVFYGLYKCRPFPLKAEFVCTLDDTAAAHFSREKVLSGDDGWTPSYCLYIL